MPAPPVRLIHVGRQAPPPSFHPPRLQFIQRGSRLIAGAWKRPAPLPKLTPSNKQSRGSTPTQTESIMSKQITFFAAAALALSTFAAQAASQEIVKLERVVITGKAVRAEPQVVAQLPRVVVTGHAVRQVAQLPRVVITGYSEATLLRQATMAAAKTSTKRI
jgi:hypothetical protein